MTMLKTVVTCAGLLALLRAQPIQAACATAPQLQGEPALVAAVTEALTRRGSAGMGSDCSPLRVQVSSADGQYLVGIEDSFGRRSQRQVASVEMVATLIETWMEPGVEAPVVEPAAPPPVVVAAPAAEPAPSRLVVSAQVESAWANDGSLWMGVGAMTCLRLGRFCVGTLVRFADDEEWAVRDDVPGARRSLSALLIGSRAIHLGRVRLVPRLGLGVARKWEERPKGRHDERWPPEESGGWLRAEAGLTAQLLVHRLWALCLDFSSEIAPLALSAEVGGADGTRHEPGVFNRLGLGVTWGTP
jgi:hypothetical protein